MFVSEKTLESEVLAAKKAAMNEFNDIIKTWHEEYALKQKELEVNFELDGVRSWSVNVWDEIKDDSTFIFVEMSTVPDNVCFAVLHHAWYHLTSHGVSDVNFRFYDSSNIYPRNLLRDEGRYSSFKRWELVLGNATYELVDSVVEILKKAPLYHGKRINAFSES